MDLCERFHCLPWSGGLLEQPASLLRLLRVAELGGYFDRKRAEADAGAGG